MQIPIESDEKLLTEYGRAFVWINTVEALLERLIWFKGKKFDSEEKISNDLEKKTLGDKIPILNKYWDENPLEKDLKNLNEDRKILAHSPVSTAIIDNGDGKKMYHMLLGKLGMNVKKELNEGYLNEITVKARSTSGQIQQIIMEEIRLGKNQ
jgi:hypothetical protein